jgi:hypothetical protein
MRRSLVALVTLVSCSTVLSADVTVTSTTTVQGPMQAMMGGITPRMVMRIKGSKTRMDIDAGGQAMATIIDLAAKQVVLLRTDQKTATILTPGAMSPLAGQAPLAMPKMEVSVKPTGQSRPIAGVPCDEFTVSMTMSMAPKGPEAGRGSAEAAAMFKDVRMLMKGSMWVAKSGPGVDDYVAFQKAAAKSELAEMLAGAIPGVGSGGLNRMLTGVQDAPGLPYLTELNVSIEGTGPMVEAMKQQGTMKVTSRVTDVSTEAIADDTFSVPADYKVVKQ